jgi:hypothetical protein
LNLNFRKPFSQVPQASLITSEEAEKESQLCVIIRPLAKTKKSLPLDGVHPLLR